MDNAGKMMPMGMSSEDGKMMMAHMKMMKEQCMKGM
jgi:hypothetical protein